MKIAKLITALILIITLGLGTAAWAAFNYNSSPGTLSGDNFFRITKGQNGNVIAENLELEGFIRSAGAFSIYSRFLGTGGNMKTGYYLIPSGSTMKEIHDLLLAGRQVLYSITFPEGWTIKTIAAKIEEEGITEASDFISAAKNGTLLAEYGIEAETCEGFLYPDTYSFPLDFPGEKVVKAMIDNFFVKLGEITDYKSMVSEELYRKVILASIVEKEYRVDDEAALMASVFYNRIDTEMSLGSCATIVYIITDILGKEHPDNLLYSDLEIESEYNTYLHPGLPPGPISNPGFTALSAAFNPAETDYYYFLLKDADAGRHVFSRTYGEHNQAYSLYIKKD